MIIESIEFKEVKDNVSMFYNALQEILKNNDIYLHYNGKAILIFKLYNNRPVNENAFSFYYKSISDKEIKKNKKPDRYLEFLKKQLELKLKEL